MTSKQVKSEIQKVLDEIPENILEDILEYLKQVKGKSKSALELSKNLQQILSEDAKLLEKLAK